MNSRRSHATQTPRFNVVAATPDAGQTVPEGSVPAVPAANCASRKAGRDGLERKTAPKKRTHSASGIGGVCFSKAKQTHRAKSNKQKDCAELDTGISKPPMNYTTNPTPRRLPVSVPERSGPALRRAKWVAREAGRNGLEKTNPFPFRTSGWTDKKQNDITNPFRPEVEQTKGSR
jgi:hypothetical protein